MNNEYIILNKETIQKRIENLEQSLKTSEQQGDEIRAGIEYYEIQMLKFVIDNSIPLTPEIEKAFDAGRTVKNYKEEWQETYSDDNTYAKYENPNDYITNIKLDI